MAEIGDILGRLEKVNSNANNTSFINMMKAIAGNPSDDVETPDDPNSLYGAMVVMYNDMVENRATDTEITEALQKIVDLTVTAESVDASEDASATLVGSEVQIKVPRAVNGEDGEDGEDGVNGYTPDISMAYDSATGNLLFGVEYIDTDFEIEKEW